MSAIDLDHGLSNLARITQTPITNLVDDLGGGGNQAVRIPIEAETWRKKAPSTHLITRARLAVVGTRYE
ncbi:MAG: hypothetical protein U0556_02795 [Dehalococcoidia bacterium]